MIVYDPAINERIRRAVRFGQTCWAEIWNALIAVGVGLILILIGPTETFSAPQFRMIASVIDERTAGGLRVFFGTLRLVALWVERAARPATWPRRTRSASGSGGGGMPDPAVLQLLDSWPAILAATTAGISAGLVPLNGFVKTLLDYRTEARKAAALKPDVARDVAGGCGGMVFDSMALSDLTAAIEGLTAAIVAGTASEEAHHTSEMTAAIARFTEVMDRFEHAGGQSRGRRRRSARSPAIRPGSGRRAWAA